MPVLNVAFTVKCDLCGMKYTYDFVPEDEVTSVPDLHDRLIRWGWVVPFTSVVGDPPTYQCMDCSEAKP